MPLAKRVATVDVLSGGRLRLLTPDERAAQWATVRTTAREAGRDPDSLEYTRWGSIDLTAEKVEALAGLGVTRLVVSATSPDPAEQADQLSAFAERFGLS